MTEWLKDQLETLANLNAIALYLIEQYPPELETWMPSLLEGMLIQIQDIVDENCIEDE